MQTTTGVIKNMWRQTQGGLLAPKRMNFPLDNLSLYLPLWHPELSGSPIISKDLNAHSCTVVGAIHTPPTSRDFDGDDNIVVPHDAAFPTTGNLTLGIWLNVPSVSADMNIMCKWNAVDTSTFLFQIVHAFTRFQCYLGGFAGANCSLLDYTAYLGSWTQLIVTWDGTDNKMYANGAYQVAAATPVAPSATTDDIYIGEREDGSNDLVGSIGEIWIYNRALSSLEILHVYNSTKWRY